MLEPKEITIDDKVFIISKFPSIAGREIITQYPTSAMPKLGDYKINEELMLKMMCYVGVRLTSSNQVLHLTTQDLVNNHTGGWETLMKLEKEVIKYNCSFFQNGIVSSFLGELAQTLPDWIIKISTRYVESLSAKEKPPSKNCKKSTL